MNYKLFYIDDGISNFSNQKSNKKNNYNIKRFCFHYSSNSDKEGCSLLISIVSPYRGLFIGVMSFDPMPLYLWFYKLCFLPLVVLISH